MNTLPGLKSSHCLMHLMTYTDFNSGVICDFNISVLLVDSLFDQNIVCIIDIVSVL